MYVHMGQIPSYVQPANPTPLNDPSLAPAPAPSNVIPFTRVYKPVYYFAPPTSAAAPAPAASTSSIIGYDSAGNPVYSTPPAVPPSVTATVSANPGSLTSWLSTGNNGLYAAIAAAVILIMLTRRR